MLRKGNRGGVPGLVQHCPGAEAASGPPRQQKTQLFVALQHSSSVAAVYSAGVASLGPEMMVTVTAVLESESPPCRPDAVIDPWLLALWDKILALYPLPPGLEIISPDVR